MPVLKNARHERFAQERAKGKTQDEAYAEAGFKPSRSAASRLSTNVNIQRRVEELKERVAEKAEWSAADRLKMLADIAAKTSSDDPRSAIAAISEANKMQGSHAATKHQIGGDGDNPLSVVFTTVYETKPAK